MLLKCLPSIIAALLAGLGCGDEAEVDRLLEAANAGGPKAFEALLKLRDVESKHAIPGLERILKEHHGTGNIFGFCAAQALFCIGTDDAHRILREYLPSDKYDAQLGIRYTFHWKMEQSKRDAFIEQYHLQSTSKELEVGLDAKSHVEDGKQRIAFSVSLRNASQKPLRLYKPSVYLGNLLLVRSAEGHFMVRMESGRYHHGFDKDVFPELAPDARLEFSISAAPRLIDSRSWKNIGLPQPRALVLDCKDMFHDLGKPGKFTVYAMYSFSRRTADAQAGRLGFPNIWSGRAVSKPIEVAIQPVRE